MAQEIIRRCDKVTKDKVCGELVADGNPTSFMINAVSYEMDLCERHYAEFTAALEPYMHVAQPTKAKQGSTVRKALKGKTGTFTTKDVRKWLVEQGRDVSPTGRIPNSLIDEYKAAQKV